MRDSSGTTVRAVDGSGHCGNPRYPVVGIWSQTYPITLSQRVSRLRVLALAIFCVLLLAVPLAQFTEGLSPRGVVAAASPTQTPGYGLTTHLGPSARDIRQPKGQDQSFVESTLVLFNNTLVQGNFRARQGYSPEAGVYDSRRNEEVVSAFGSNILDIVNTTTNLVVATVQVGSGPLGIAYDRGRSELFVANYNSDSVSVVNDSTNMVIATLAVGDFPDAAAYDSNKGEVFVANANSNTVSVINDTTDSLAATIPVGIGPSALAYDSTRGYVYVANFNSNDVSIISDSSDRVVKSIPAGLGPDGAAFDNQTNQTFVSNFGAVSDNVTVINDSNNVAVGSLAVGVNPVAIEYDYKRAELFVSNSYSNNVSILNATGLRSAGQISTGSYPELAGYDPARGKIFVANGMYSLSVIDDSTDVVVGTSDLGESPGPIAFASGPDDLLVADLDTNLVSTINSSTNDVVQQVWQGDAHWAVAYDIAKGEVFLPNQLSDNVSILQIGTAG